MIDDRVLELKGGLLKGSVVVYWTSREQRVECNFALLAAMEEARRDGIGVIVAFCVADSFLGASSEAFAFMGEGLKELQKELAEKNIPFRLLYGNPPKEIANFAKSVGASSIYLDSDPLKIKKKWVKELIDAFCGRITEVDSRCVVPARRVSQKKEFAAYTIRPKINKLLPKFLIAPPVIKPQSGVWTYYENDYSRFDALSKNKFFRGGKKAASERLEIFVKERLSGYAAYRNDPTKEYQSQLSPYLHFGQISSLEVALCVLRQEGNDESKAAFLEELIVRRELAENFCLYCDDYDNENSMEPWAKENAKITDQEAREYIYDLKGLEDAKTHDELWNAAQKELKICGKIHGYMRMYWAKKILEWTPNAKEAFLVANYLNDKYALDGRDPNGYAGVAWSVGGAHDRAWPSRKVFGKIRYMNYNGCKSKFKVKEYILKIETLSKGGGASLF